jgi:DNA invertase Pin-like site-specific DNA recombinase
MSGSPSIIYRLCSVTNNAAVYCRISNDKEGAGLGVRRQAEACRKEAANRGLTVGRVFSDNDISAYSGKPRPGYLEMLRALEAGTFDAVIIWHSDRLHRSPVELERYIGITHERGIPTYSVTGGLLDLATPTGRLNARMVGTFARYESEHRAERIQAKHAQSAKDGRYRGGSARPFGYLADGITLEPTEAALIRDAYQSVISGDSMGAIIRDWNARGVMTSTGKEWGYTTLRQMLRRERNYGASVHKGKVVGAGQWAPIVDEATYRRATAILHDPKRRNSVSNQGKHLVAGLLLCQCGAVMRPGTGSSRGGGRIISYICTSGDHYLSRQAKHIDDYVTTLVLGRVAEPGAADLLVPPSSADRASELQREATTLRQQMDDSLALFKERVITADELRTMRSDLTAKLGALEDQLADPVKVEVLGELITAKDPRAVWEGMTWRARRRAVQALLTVTCLPVPAGVARRFNPDYLQVTWKVPS